MMVSSTTLHLGGPADRPATRLECEWRVLRALAVARTPIVRMPRLGAKCAWPDTIDTEDEKRWQNDLVQFDHHDIFKPDRRDLADWDTALCWFAAVSPPDPRGDRIKPRNPWQFNRPQKVIKMRSFGLQSGGQPSWAWICDALCMRSAYQVKQEYNHGIDRCWGAAKAYYGLPQSA